MNSSEAPLTVRQGIVIVSRALCVLLLFNAALSLTSFPAMIASLLHEWNSMSRFAVASQENYVYGIYIRDRRRDSAACARTLLRVVVLSLWAGSCEISIG